MSRNDIAKESEIWRKVSSQMYFDTKYMALSPTLPSGRSLWHHLIHGPHLGPIPGLSRCGRMTMAEELGWDLEAFDVAFGEVFQQGMAKADWKAKVVWLPNALKHNLPQSPNVVLGWRKAWGRIQDCPLKLEAYEHILDRLKSWRPPSAAAFVEACPKPTGKPYAKPLNNQESRRAGEQDRAPSQERGAKKVGHHTRGQAPDAADLDDPFGGAA